MSSRLDYASVAPEGRQALVRLKSYIEKCGIDPKLRFLIEIRASQINGCAFCVDKHCEEARAVGETQQRLDNLAVWHESPFFDARERAALEWAESVTLLAETGVPDEVYEAALKHFSEKELVDLNFVVINMNALNRLGVTFRKQPEAR